MQLEVISRGTELATHDTPLLFVHGAWHAAWCWDDYFLPYFAEQGYAVHALSLRGHGASEGRIRGSRIMHYVDDVALVAAALPVPPIIIGHSMGGLVMQRYLETRDAPAAILMTPVPVHGAIGATMRVAWHHPLAFLRINLGTYLYPIVSTPKLARWTLFSDDMPDEDVTRYAALVEDESYLAFLDMLLLALPRPSRVDVPMLVVAGDTDALFSPAEAQKTARAYKANFEVFPGMAHDLMIEPEWQKVADRMLSWLAGQGF